MNRLDQLFQNKSRDILNIYFTAGHPRLEDTEKIILALERNGTDLIELGMPYSDPLADGPTIQESGQKALKNGMTLAILFDQVKLVRTKTEIPLIMMGYVNQVMQFGVEQFLMKCHEVGIDGVILPDLPLHIYEEEYKEMFEKYGVKITFLCTPQTPDARLSKIDELSTGFVYVVSDSSITGAKNEISSQQLAYFDKIKNSNMKNNRLIGFGISDHKTFSTACQYANGAIIGSAFIKALDKGGDVDAVVEEFVKSVVEEPVNS